MKLSQMQDLGGCRAVMGNIGLAQLLRLAYADGDSKNPKRHQLIKAFDYIESPKPDGYRGIHLVYKYRTEAKQYEMFNGLRIEIQLRSKLMHAWATAVETVDAFTGQALKSSAGDERWARFFALMGSAMAIRERTPLVLDTPSERTSIRQELLRVARELKVKPTLEGWRMAMMFLDSSNVVAQPNADLFLLKTDIEKRRVTLMTFTKTELERATNRYLELEKQILDGANMQAVLVSVESVAALKKAYPSYFADTEAFLSALDKATEPLK